jgi:hypothetical protein
MAKAKKTTKTKKTTKSFSLGVKGGKYQAVGGAKLKSILRPWDGMTLTG